MNKLTIFLLAACLVMASCDWSDTKCATQCTRANVKNNANKKAKCCDDDESNCRNNPDWRDDNGFNNEKLKKFC